MHAAGGFAGTVRWFFWNEGGEPEWAEQHAVIWEQSWQHAVICEELCCCV
eukprot:SAG31_NODE_9514_length_1265_cov_4.884220_1_plen_50_part_00